jgi:hypothetical protein
VIKELVLKWALRHSETEVVTFLGHFAGCELDHKGAVVGMAALMHHQYAEMDPDFRVLVRSQKDTNHGLISKYIVEMNCLINDFNKADRLNAAAAMKLWNVTFRCMSNATLHHHGVTIWATASESFPHAQQWLAAKLEAAERAGDKRDVQNLRVALELYDFVPPQFAGR